MELVDVLSMEVPFIRNLVGLQATAALVGLQTTAAALVGLQATAADTNAGTNAEKVKSRTTARAVNVIR